MPRDERIYPDLKNGNFAFHLFRYVWAIPFAYDRVVLDAGCGSGYGSELLSLVARSVVAVDHDPEAVAENRAKYASRSNLAFAVQDVADLSFPDESFDLVVSFEVYEHIDRSMSEKFLDRVARLCRPGGSVLLSTPNRLVEAPFMRSADQSYRYHVNSVSPAELRARLRRHFSSVRLFGQRRAAPWVKSLLRAFDVLNLRHSLLSYMAKERLERGLTGQSLSTRCDLRSIHIAPWLIRQSGIIVAVCRK